MKEHIQYIWEEHDTHDCPLSALNFDFEQSEVCIVLEMCDDEADEYVDFRMIFGGIYKFVSELNSEGKFNPDECYGWTWQETEPGRFEAEFYFFSQETGWTVTLGFTSLRTEGGLSEEARTARADYFDKQAQD